jgi:hypothetical protein
MKAIKKFNQFNEGFDIPSFVYDELRGYLCIVVDGDRCGEISFSLLQRDSLMDIKEIESIADDNQDDDWFMYQDILDDIDEKLKEYHFINIIECESGRGYGTLLIKEALKRTKKGLCVYMAETQPEVIHIFKKLGAKPHNSFYVLEKNI